MCIFNRFFQSGCDGGCLVRARGIVVMHQQLQAAKGVVFVTLDDATGSVNVIVWKSRREKQRSERLHSRLMAVWGVWQRDVESGGEVRHLIAQRLADLTSLHHLLHTGKVRVLWMAAKRPLALSSQIPCKHGYQRYLVLFVNK